MRKEHDDDMQIKSSQSSAERREVLPIVSENYLPFQRHLVRLLDFPFLNSGRGPPWSTREMRFEPFCPQENEKK